MSLTTTQAIMVDAVQRTADVVQFTEKHPVTRIKALINQGLGALVRVCLTTNPEFRPVASTTITTDGLATSFALPSNFRSLLSVEYTVDDIKTWLNPHDFSERPGLTDTETTATAGRARSYKVLGSNIELLPLPDADHTALVWYATSVTQLAADADTFDTMDRLDSYVIWWAAREIAMERADWERHDRLSMKMQEMEADIRILSRSIDLSAPAKVIELGRADARKFRYR
jgi:hypothetical protein